MSMKTGTRDNEFNKVSNTFKFTNSINLKRKYNTHDNAKEYKLAVLSILLNNSMLHVTAKGNNLTS